MRKPRHKKFEEIIVDYFAGGGGASTGISQALGRSVDYAVNHDRYALAMHRANHPDTKHLEDDVWKVNPKELVKSRQVGLIWLSPDCTFFSKARGGKPIKKNIRGLAWVALYWALMIMPRMIMIENVEEFQDWAPLGPDSRPDPKRKGRTFRRFIQRLKNADYKVEYRELQACDYGAATTRTRLVIIARRDRLPIVWPEPTHGPASHPKVKAGIWKPYKSAASIIDFRIPCKSIFGRKRALAENTIARIFKGIWKFVINNPNPFIVGYFDGKLERDFSAECAFLLRHYGGNNPLAGSDLREPTRTLTSVDHHSLVMCHLVRHQGQSIGTDANLPAGTLMPGGQSKNGLIVSHLMKFRGTSESHLQSSSQSLYEPVPAITSGGNHIAEVRALLIKYYKSGIGQSLHEPLDTLTSKCRFGLVMVESVEYQIVDVGMRMLQPKEQFAAQGFPDDYIIDPFIDGKRLSKTQQTKMCGNSVSPPMARAVVEANYAPCIDVRRAN